MRYLTSQLFLGLFLGALLGLARAEAPTPLYSESFDTGEQEGVVGQAGRDFNIDAAGKVDLDRGTLAFFAKRITAEPDRWWDSLRARYPAGDRHGYRRIGGIAQGIGEGYYFQGIGFEAWNDELMFMFLDAGRYSPPIRLGTLSQDWPVNTWRHLAVVWDRNQGLTVYLDGKQAFSNWGNYQWQWNLYPRALFLNGICDELVVYSDCLTAPQIAQLAAGKAPTGEPLPIEASAARRQNELTTYGWLSPGLEALPSVANNQAIELQFARIARMAEWNRPQAQPRDGLRTTTWPPVYYGPAIKGQRLEVDLATGESYDHVQALIQRPFIGQLAIGDQTIPLKTESATVWHHRFSQPVTTIQAAILRRQGQLGRLDFYRVKQGAQAPATAALNLAPGAIPDSPLGLAVATDVPERFHQPIAAKPEQVPAWTLETPAFGGFQAFTAPPEEALAYDGVTVTLKASKITNPTPVRIVVKEPVHSEKDWLIADAVLTPTGAGTQTFTITLKGRPVINLPPLKLRPSKAKADTPYEAVPGVAFAVTVTAAEPITWALGENGSTISFHQTDRATALPIATEDQIEFMRQGFASVMEGHLWGEPRIQVPLTWLALNAPERKEFKQIARRASLRQVFEDYEPPGYETHPEPANPWQAPEWAIWQREVMQEIREYVYWCIDTKQLPTGEFGSTFNDDTIQTEVWINYALAMDDSHKIANSLRRFYNGLYRYGLDHGVSRYITDAGHASEEGSSSISMALMLDYGDPLTYERLLAAASHYDLWLKKTDEGYVAYSGYMGAPGTWRSGEFAEAYGSGAHQLLVPAGYLTWYNRHPTAWQYLDGDIHAHPKGQGRMTEFFAGALDWWNGNETVEPGKNPKATAKPYKPAGTFRPYRSRGADDEPLWRNWRNTGDLRYLVDMYRGNVEWFDNYDWLITNAMPSADRISEPTVGMIASRLGAKASDRGSAYLTWPEYAVTFVSGADAVAALVTSNRVDSLSMQFFPFTEQPHIVRLRLWRLHPGNYQLTLKSGDKELANRQLDVIRGTSIELTLPPSQLSDLTLTPLEIHEPDFALPDPAISLDTIEVVYNRHLIVKVHNLGSTPAENILVRVRDKRSGEVIPGGEQGIARIEPALDFIPKYQAVQFDDIYAVSSGLIVEISTETPDLNPWNNRVELEESNIFGPDYIGIERRARR